MFEKKNCKKNKKIPTSSSSMRCFDDFFWKKKTSPNQTSNWSNPQSSEKMLRQLHLPQVTSSLWPSNAWLQSFPRSRWSQGYEPTRWWSPALEPPVQWWKQGQFCVFGWTIITKSHHICHHTCFFWATWCSSNILVWFFGVDIKTMTCFCWWRCGNRPRCWRAIWEMDRMVTTTTWIKALALRNAKVAKVFWGLLAAISCFFCNPRYIINSVFIIPQIDTGKREMDQRDIDPLKSVKNKHLMWKGCKICKITVIKKIWNKPKVTISVFIYTVYSLPSFRSRIVKHSELSAMRDII